MALVRDEDDVVLACLADRGGDGSLSIEIDSRRGMAVETSRDRAAIAYPVLASCHLAGVDPNNYIADVLRRLGRGGIIYWMRGASRSASSVIVDQ